MAFSTACGDATPEDKIVEIEILNASKKLDLTSLLSYSFEFEKEILNQKQKIA